MKITYAANQLSGLKPLDGEDHIHMHTKATQHAFEYPNV